MKQIISILFCSALLFASSIGQSNNNNPSIYTKADSLFKNKKFIEAFDIYDSIHTKHQIYSTSALAKMAYIKQASGNPTEAIYFLSKLNKLSYSLSSTNKIIEIASEQELKGYEKSDIDTFLFYFNQNRQTMLYGLLALCSFFMFIILIQLIRKKNSSSSFALLIIFIMALGITNNINDKRKKAIIQKDDCYLMEGPSNGSKVLLTLKKGDKIDIKSKNDIWVKSSIDDHDGFINFMKMKEI